MLLESTQTMSEHIYQLYTELGKTKKDISVREFLTYVVEVFSQNLVGATPTLLAIADQVFEHLEQTPYGYPDVTEAIQALDALADRIVFWTQGETIGQLEKIQNLGFRAQQPHPDHPTVTQLDRHWAVVSRTKLPAIKPLMTQLINQVEAPMVATMLFVDDKLETVRAAVELARSLGANACGVWMRRPDGTYRDQVPAGETLDTITPQLYQEHIIPVTDLTEFVTLRQQLGEKHHHQSQDVTVFLDIDHSTWQTIQHRWDMCRLFALGLSQCGLIDETT